MTEQKHVTVSVVIPVYNGVDFLPFALNSVLTQTYPHLEIIIIDDASNQPVNIYLESMYLNELRSGRVRCYRNEERKERCDSRNRGIQMASSEIVAFLDHDDQFKPAHFAEIVNAFQTFPDVDFVYDEPGELIDFNGRFVKRFPPRIWRHDLYRSVLSAGFITSGMTFRKNALERIGGFNRETIQREDLELSVRAVIQFGLKVKMVRTDTVQIRRIKTRSHKQPTHYPNDLFMRYTRRVIELVETYDFFKRASVKKQYLPYLYLEGIKTAIEFKDFSYARFLFKRLFALNPFALTGWWCGFKYIVRYIQVSLKMFLGVKNKITV